MPYNIVNIGPNSNIIDIPLGEIGEDLLYDAIKGLMEAAGYTVFDESFSTGTTGYKGHFIQHHDDDTDDDYRKGIYIAVVNSGTTRYIYCDAFESDGSTVNNDTNSAHGKLLTTESVYGAKLYCFIGKGYAFFMYAPVDGGIYSEFTGVFEHTDELKNGLGTGPGQTSSRLLATSSSFLLDASNQFEVPSMVGYNGSRVVMADVSHYFWISSNVGSWGNTLQTTGGVALIDNPILAGNNHPVTGKPMGSNIFVNANVDVSATPLGYIYGLKQLNRYAGNFLDVVSFKCDDKNFISTSDTAVDTDHFIINMYGQTKPDVCFAIPR
jgi:hypothetical protein